MAVAGINRGGKQLAVHGWGSQDNHEDQRGEQVLAAGMNSGMRAGRGIANKRKG